MPAQRERKPHSEYSERPDFPPAPAWAVGADREHTGPSGMGPGEDQPGFGQEIDVEDAEGVAGGFMQDEATDADRAAPMPYL